MTCQDPTWREGDERWGRHEADKWPEAFPKPRTCSYCGSVHPEDLIKLIEAGWELEPSTKFYKSYWHPPGYWAHYNLVMKDLVGHIEGTNPVEPMKHVQPTPPVKLYSDHVTIEIAERINNLLRQRQAEKKGEGDGLENAGK